MNKDSRSNKLQEILEAQEAKAAAAVL